MIELSQLWPIIITLLISGMMAGTLAGLLGVGGGIINVPVLYFVFQGFGMSPGSAMVVATGTSLATIVPTSISSIRSHHKRGNVDWALIQRWWPFIITGVLLGSWLVTQFDGRYFAFIFALIALLMAYKLGLSKKESALYPRLPPMPFQGLLGSVIGFFSVMAGIGGGTLGVTILTAFNYVIHRAVGSCAVFGFLIALPGALVLFLFAEVPTDAPVGTWGYVNLAALILLVPLSVSFAPVGVWLGSKIDGVKLKKIFAVFLTVTAVRMMLQVMGW